MRYFVLLGITTTILVVFAVILWRRTRSLAFPIGLFLVYYWTIHGAWILVAQRLGFALEMPNSFIDEELFGLDLDKNYFDTLFYYSLFVLVMASTLAWGVMLRKAPSSVADPRAVLWISHRRLLALTWLAAIGSYFLVAQALDQASELNLPGYTIVRRGYFEHNLLMLHEVAKRAALFPAAVGFAVLVSTRDGVAMTGKRSAWIVISYLGLFGFLFWLSFSLGGRNALFSALILFLCAYTFNKRNQKFVSIFGFGLVGIFFLGVIGTLRGLPYSEMIHDISRGDFSFVANAFSNVITSNEAFSAHYSMYAILSFDFPHTYFKDISNFLASIVPRMFWPDRPEQIYFFYHNYLALPEFHFFTIHHAAAWYLSFGVLGVVLGAYVWGALWALLYNRGQRWYRYRAHVWRVFYIVAPWVFVAYIPALIRAGAQGYKGVINGWVVTTIVLVLSARTVYRVVSPEETPNLQPPGTKFVPDS